MSTSADSVPVVTIDGPSGSGKGTVSQRVAGEFGWHLLDSGALYRLLACAAQRDGAGLDDAAALADLAGRIEGEFTVTPDGTEVVLLDGADVTDVLRTEATGNAASRLAAPCGWLSACAGTRTATAATWGRTNGSSWRACRRSPWSRTLRSDV